VAGEIFGIVVRLRLVPGPGVWLAPPLLCHKVSAPSMFLAVAGADDNFFTMLVLWCLGTSGAVMVGFG
jgi:hypothetical protein